MRVVDIGQALSPNNKCIITSGHTDLNGVAKIDDCGDSTLGRYDTNSGIAIAGVFDGVGSTLNSRGMKGDALSSQVACQAVSDTLTNLDESLILRQLYYSALMAHVKLNNTSITESINLSTTATYGVVFPNSNLYIPHLGDSRAYRFDGNNLDMLTLDDRDFSGLNGLHETFKQLYRSLVDTSNPEEELLRAMQLFQPPTTYEEFWDYFDKKITFRDIAELNLLLGFQEEFSNLKLKSHADLVSTEDADRICGVLRAGIYNRGNIITRSISSNRLPLVSITKAHLNEGDILLFFTDGLTDVLPTDDIRDQIYEWKDSSAELIARVVVKDARDVCVEGKYYGRKKMHDEIGAVVVKWGSKT